MITSFSHTNLSRRIEKHTNEEAVFRNGEICILGRIISSVSVGIPCFFLTARIS